MRLRPFRAALMVVAALLVPSFASAADFVVPKAEIVISDGSGVVPAGKAVGLGELVDLTVTKSADPVPHLAAVSYEWKILEAGKERNYKSAGDKSSVWYGAGVAPKKQQAFAVVTYLFVVRAKEDDPKSAIKEVATRTQFLYVEVSIGGVIPPPTPPPGPDNPTPPPAPTVPDGRFKLGKTAYDLSLAKVAVSPDRQKAAAALATSFRGMASSIKAGAFTDAKVMLPAVTTSNRTALANAGVPREAWTPFFTDLMEVVFAKYERDEISTLADFADAWNEIAAGLEAVR